MNTVQETLEAKLPSLLEQFPGATEEFVRTVAQADPTGSQYTGWLLKTLQENQWNITEADHVSTVIDAFNRLKDTEAWTGQKTVNEYKTVSALVTDIEQHIETNPVPIAPAAPAVEGAKELAQNGTLKVYEITTPQAASLFARSQGGADSPSTQWPTLNEKIAGRYLVDGPLFVVTDSGKSIAQIHFGRHEAKNERNLNLTTKEALKIAPLFTGQSFAAEFGTIPYQPGGWQLDDSDINEYLKRLGNKFIAQRKHGFFLNGKWIEPVSDDKLLERRWRAKEPEFRHALKLAQQDHDQAVIERAGRRHPDPVGLVALANAVYTLDHA